MAKNGIIVEVPGLSGGAVVRIGELEKTQLLENKNVSEEDKTDKEDEWQRIQCGLCDPHFRKRKPRTSRALIGVFDNPRRGWLPVGARTGNPFELSDTSRVIPRTLGQFLRIKDSTKTTYSCVESLVTFARSDTLREETDASRRVAGKNVFEVDETSANKDYLIVQCPKEIAHFFTIIEVRTIQPDDAKEMKNVVELSDDGFRARGLVEIGARLFQQAKKLDVRPRLFDSPIELLVKNHELPDVRRLARRKNIHCSAHRRIVQLITQTTEILICKDKKNY